MNRIIISVLFVLAFNVASAQKPGNSYSKQITEQANKMAKALLNKDYNTFTMYVLPAIIQASGGKAKLIETLKKSMAGMAKEGNGFIAMRIEPPSAVIDTANTLQCILPETVRMKTAEGVVDNHTTLLAVSLDKGKTWKFVDMAGPEALNNVRQLMPVVSVRHIVPQARMEIADR